MDDIRELYNKYLNASFPNRRGDEIMGIDIVLAKYGLNDSLIAGCIDIKYAVGDISSSLIADGLTINKLDLSTPLRKRIILMEFYYHFLQWSLKNKSTTC